MKKLVIIMLFAIFSISQANAASPTQGAKNTVKLTVNFTVSLAKKSLLAIHDVVKQTLVGVENGLVSAAKRF
jgi:hypothetical protein